MERALQRCQRRHALPVGLHALTVDTDDRGRASAIHGGEDELRTCLTRARIRARPSSRYVVRFEVAPGPIVFARMARTPPDVTGTGAASEPDACVIRIVTGPDGRPRLELHVTESGAPRDSIHAFFAWGDAWPPRFFEEMTLERTLHSGAQVFTATLERVRSGQRIAGWVSVDGGRTMAYCDGDGAPFAPEQLLVAP